MTYALSMRVFLVFMVGNDELFTNHSCTSYAVHVDDKTNDAQVHLLKLLAGTI